VIPADCPQRLDAGSEPLLLYLEREFILGRALADWRGRRAFCPKHRHSACAHSWARPGSAERSSDRGGRTLVAVALLERRVPYEPAWNHSHGDLVADLFRNLANHGLIQLTVAGSFLLRSVWMPEPRLWPAQAAVGAGSGSGRGAQPEPLRNALLESR